MQRIIEIEPRWRRVTATVALLVVLLVVLDLLAPAVGLSSGYGSAQSLRASKLAERADLPRLRSQTIRDMAIYVPAYLVLGAAFIWMVVGGLGGRAAAMVLLAIGGLADLVETALFRRSLTRLIGGAAPSAVDRATRVTAAFTGIKWTALIAAGLATLLLAALEQRRGG